MKAGLLAVVLAIVGAGTWLVASGARECGWVDTSLGLSGCIGAHRVSDLGSLGNTLVVDRDGQLVIAGASYRGEDSRLHARATVVTMDLQDGDEVARTELGFRGLPDQLRLSPTDGRFALSCNSIYVCDLADAPSETRYTGAAMIGLFDPVGERLWSHVVPRDVARPSAEGRAFDLAFESDGSAVVAGPVSFRVETGSMLNSDPRELEPHGVTLDATRSVEIAGAQRPLDLPADYVPFTRLQTATSPDGRHLATLSRRFSGPGDVRAILHVWDATTGALSIRHDIRADLFQALAWHPDGRSVIVATASPQVRDAHTEIRLYRTEAVQ